MVLNIIVQENRSVISVISNDYWQQTSVQNVWYTNRCACFKVQIHRRYPSPTSPPNGEFVLSFTFLLEHVYSRTVIILMRHNFMCTHTFFIECASLSNTVKFVNCLIEEQRKKDIKIMQRFSSCSVFFFYFEIRHKSTSTKETLKIV